LLLVAVVFPYMLAWQLLWRPIGTFSDNRQNRQPAFSISPSPPPYNFYATAESSFVRPKLALISARIRIRVYGVGVVYSTSREMPSSIDLEPFRAEIERRLLSSDQSMSQIVKWLADDYSVEITQRTLERRCKT